MSTPHLHLQPEAGAPLWRHTVERTAGADAERMAERWIATARRPGLLQLTVRRESDVPRYPGAYGLATESHERAWNGRRLEPTREGASPVPMGVLRQVEEQLLAMAQVGHIPRLGPGEDAAAAGAELACYGIRPETLQRPEFRHSLRVTPQGHAQLPIVDVMGHGSDFRPQHRCYEWPDWANAAPTRPRVGGVWLSAGTPADNHLVITSSPLEALSLQQRDARPNTRFLALVAWRGSNEGLAPTERHLVALAIAAMPKGSTIGLAIGHDSRLPAHGEHVVRQLQALAPEVSFFRQAPPLGRSWNEALQRLEQDFIRVHGRSRPASVHVLQR